MSVSGERPSAALRIVLVLGYPTRSRGGTEIAALSFASTLAKRGHQVTTIFRHEGELIAEYEKFCDRVFVLKRRRDFAPLLALLAGLARRERVVLYGHHAGRIFSLVTLARILNAKCVCHLHLPPDPMGQLARFGLRHADRFLTVSNATANDWIRALDVSPARLRVVPNGIDTARFAPGNTAAAKASFELPASALVVSYVGRLDRQKGVDLLIRAFAAVCARKPDTDCYLLIAGGTVLGGDEYVKELNELARSSPNNRVRLIGRVEDPERLFRASELSVLPSIWAEPQGLTLLESMACGAPTIGSAIGGIPEVLEADFPGHLFPAGNVEALAERISALLEWRTHDPDLGSRCRDMVVSKFGIDACVDRIERELVEVALG